MKRFSKKLSLIGLSLAMLIPNISFADKIELENSIEPALVTAIVQKDQVEALCAQQSCGEVNKLFTEDKFGQRTPVEGLVQLTYFKSFGYESAPEQVLSTISSKELDSNTVDFMGSAELAVAHMPPEQAPVFCSTRDCVHISEVFQAILSVTDISAGTVSLVTVTYWDRLNPVPEEPEDESDF